MNATRPLGTRFARAWLTLVIVHASAVALIGWWSRHGLPGALRDPLGMFAVASTYGPIALASRLGVPRGALERAAWLFGELTPAGWVVVLASWLAIHALLAAAWTGWRARSRAGRER
jgi:hypothetical protein